MKRCAKCGAEKPLTSFQLTRKRVNERKTDRRQVNDLRLSTDGRKSTCKACYKKVGRARKGAEPIHVVAERAVNRRAEVAARAAMRAELRAIRAAAKAAIAARVIADDPSCARLSPVALAYRVRYRTEPEFRAKEIMRRQRMDYSNIPDDGTLTPEVVRALFGAARVCPYCACEMHCRDKVLDHVYPRARGGAHSIRNVVVCCGSCNARKHDLLPAQWAARLCERQPLASAHDAAAAREMILGPSQPLLRGPRELEVCVDTERSISTSVSG